MAVLFAVTVFIGCAGSPDDTSTSSNGNSGGKDDSSDTQLPVIRITTKEPLDPSNPLAFVTEPVSDTVKLHNHTWESYVYDDKPAPWYEECSITVEDGTKVEVLTEIDAKVKARGNYTTTYDKKGLRIKFDKKQSMLGLHNGEKYKNWVLLASWKDYSMVRDYSAYMIARLMSDKYYVSDAKFVEVYINDEYWGGYLLAEQQEAKRIGITEAAEDDGVTQTGYLLEYDAYTDIIKNQSINGELVEQDFMEIDGYGKYTDLNGEISYAGVLGYTIKSDYDDVKKVFAKKYMQTVWDICREAVENETYYEFDADYSDKVASNVTSTEECVSKVIDIDSLVNTFILQEIACDLDLNWSSFYMDFDAATGKKLTFEAPWDFDSSFGNHVQRQIGEGGITHLFSVTDKLPCVGNPWTIIFAKEKWFQDKVRAKWTEMGGIKTKVIAEINKLSNDPVYVEAFARNYKKWNNIGKAIGDELCDASISCKTQREAADKVIEFLNQRFAMLDKDFKEFKSSNVFVPITDKASALRIVELDGETYEFKMNIEAKTDGLHITKQNNPLWNRVTLSVYDETDGVELLFMEDIDYEGNNIHNSVVYPFVQNDHIYIVTMKNRDNNWGNYYEIKAKVKAMGGQGNSYIKFDNLNYNPVTNSITFDNYEECIPSEITENDLEYRVAHLFNGPVWENINIIDTSWGGRWKMSDSNTMQLIMSNYAGGWSEWNLPSPLPDSISAVIYYEFELNGLKFKTSITESYVYQK